jgi:hypothetical protein
VGWAKDGLVLRRWIDAIKKIILLAHRAPSNQRKYYYHMSIDSIQSNKRFFVSQDNRCDKDKRPKNTHSKDKKKGKRGGNLHFAWSGRCIMTILTTVLVVEFHSLLGLSLRRPFFCVLQLGHLDETFCQSSLTLRNKSTMITCNKRKVSYHRIQTTWTRHLLATFYSSLKVFPLCPPPLELCSSLFLLTSFMPKLLKILRGGSKKKKK